MGSPVVPPDRNYEGLVDGGDWHIVETILALQSFLSE